jgi:HK97 family phage major capsid protein
MSFTKKGDVFIPELLEDALVGAYRGMIALYGTGAAIIKTSMPAGKAQLGDQVKIPYFNTMGELQDLNADGDALTPTGVSTTVELATVRHSGLSFEATKWAELSGVSDPYAEGARQMAVATVRRIDQALIDVATAAGSDLLTKDVYSAVTPRTMDYDLIIDGKMLWGDEQDEIAMMVVHSKTKGDLYKLKDSIGRPLLVDPTQGGLSTFAGIPIMVSDRIAPTSDSPAKYTSLILKKGALVFWMNGTPRVLTDTDILADTDLAAAHTYWAAHRYKRMPGYTRCGVVRIYHN